jgi:hypothetical protein
LRLRLAAEVRIVPSLHTARTSGKPAQLNRIFLSRGWNTRGVDSVVFIELPIDLPCWDSYLLSNSWDVNLRREKKIAPGLVYADQ